MIELINNFEYRNLEINGLDIRKHAPKLNKYREDGWVLFRSSPNINNQAFKYRLKRPLPHTTQ